MSTIQISTSLSDSPKLLEVGPHPAWLYISGLCYAVKWNTGGFVPREFLNRYDTQDCWLYQEVEKLIDACLWEKVPGGYKIIDRLECYIDSDCDMWDVANSKAG